MKKAYEIGGQTVTLKSSLHTWFTYKATFGRELAEDMERAIAADRERRAESDDVRRAVLYGEECRLFLQLFWAFADEGTVGLPPFETWLGGIEGVDIADVVKVVSTLFGATVQPDRRNRGKSGERSSGSICTEAIADNLLGLGVSIADMRDLTVGQAINIIHEHVRNVKRAKGEDVPDPEEQYRILKEAVEMIESGQVTNYGREEYERVKKKLAEWESL